MKMLVGCASLACLWFLLLRGVDAVKRVSRWRWLATGLILLGLADAVQFLLRIARRISEDWQRAYTHPIYMLETFVDPARFRGTCYRAANWILLGHTTGRGKNDLTHQPNRPIKEVLGYPLTRCFRQQLVEG